MFAIPNCSRSIGIQVLLAMAFAITEFTLSGHSLPSNEACVNVSGETICYFKGSKKDKKWNETSQLCRSFDSTLPIIRNINDQIAVAGYLKSHLNSSFAWTAGKNYAFDDWTWISGETLIGSVEENKEPEVEKDNAALNTEFKFTAHAGSQELPYICQFQDDYCNTSTDNVMIVTDKCLRLINDSRSWYDARNQCFMDNGDLAVIGDVELGFLESLKLNQSYWIGLRKNSFRWTLNDDVKSNEEIKYTNWDNTFFATDGDCIIIDVLEGKWKATGCGESRTVVCQRGRGVTSPTVTTDAPTETIHTMSLTQESTNGGSQSSTQQGLLFAAVGVGIIIVICIIVIVVFVLRTKNGRSEQSKLNDGYVQNNREELDIRITNAAVLYTSINEPVDASVDRSDDIRGVYADIEMLTPEQSEDGGTSQQPGIVYASLDFNKDSTNLEPDKTHPTSPTKVGPLGDIYAVPDVKGHAVTSPGIESPSHPVMVTPQGDVYAIPMKISTSPTAKSPTGAVYANLQPATLDKEQVAVDNDETK